ncbi:MAG: hypothetical protein KDD69_04120 [Bdellovibrionales bacterium]|nr:hypothetical protein [Bdellovibrionales bacterium]
MKKILLAALFLMFMPAFGQAADCDGNLVDDETEMLRGDAPDCDRDGQPDMCSLLPSGFGYAEQGDALASVSANAPVGSGKFAELNDDGMPDAVLIAGVREEGSSVISAYRLFFLLSTGLSEYREPVEVSLGGRRSFSFREGERGKNVYIPGVEDEPALLLVNDGEGGFAQVEDPAEDEINIILRADFSGDGVPDLIRERDSDSGPGLSKLTVSYGQGNDAFAAEVELLDAVPEAGDVRLVDMNGDATADVLVLIPGDGALRLQVFLGGAGEGLGAAAVFTLEGVDASFSALGDLNGNALPDLILDGDAALVVLDLDPASDDPEALPLDVPTCSGRTFVDLDGNGSLDLSCLIGRRVGRNFGERYLRSYLNDGSGQFQLADTRYYYLTSGPPGTLLRQPSDVVFQDVSGDEKPDLLAVWLTSGTLGGTLGVERLRQTTVGAVEPPAGIDQNANGVPDSCEQDGLFRYRYSLWNSYAELVNVLELVNLDDQPARTRIVLRDQVGAIAHQVDVPLPPRGQRDIILNEFPVFAAPAYGVVETISSGNVAGAVTYYRGTAADAAREAAFDTGDFDFAFQLPLRHPFYRAGALLFNTSQPSREPQDQLPIVQWLTIVNLGRESRAFRVTSVQEGGAVLRDLEVRLEPFERVDLDGGHGLAGSGQRGFHEVRPLEGEGSPFIALLTRYGTTFDPRRYAFAFPIFLAEVSNDSILPISTGGGAGAWVELANLHEESREVVYEVCDPFGDRTENSSFYLAPFEQRHFYVPSLLPDNSSGTFTFRAQGSVAGQVVSYYYSPTGSIQTAFMSPGHVRQKPVLHASYNTFLGTQNWLRLIPFSSGARAQINVLAPGTGDVLGGRVEEIFASGIRELDIHNGAVWGTTPESYGLVEVDVSFSGQQSVLELLRVRPTPSGGVDFIMRTTIE